VDEESSQIRNKQTTSESEDFPEAEEVSPYFDYATSSLETLKGEWFPIQRIVSDAEYTDTAKRLDTEFRLPESKSILTTVEDCRVWMIQHMEYMQTASLPALSRMGKLFTRLQEELYNAVMLPTAKQIKVLRTNEKSLKIGE
jgi:hypothetical protein